MDLSKLSPGKGARRVSRRVGRGEGSGRGKTSGRGGKGQTARTGGKVRPGFEGGQMPLYRRIPKLGFRSRQKTLGLNSYNIVNLELLERFEDGAVVTAESLAALGCEFKSKNKAGVKVLGRGELTKKLSVKVQAISEAAKSKIEARGGSVEIVGA
jgi:large subunit ribosomal protein L15